MKSHVSLNHAYTYNVDSVGSRNVQRLLGYVHKGTHGPFGLLLEAGLSYFRH